MFNFKEFERVGWNDRSTAEHYDRMFSAITTQAVSALLDAAQVSRGDTVLDVATGPGYVAGAARARGAQVSAIDFSKEKLALARAHFSGVDFREGDAEALAFGDAIFDAVTCNYGVPHFSAPDRFFAEACRVLKPGGRLSFSVWDVPAQARAFGVIYEAIARHGSLDVGLPVGPNFFLFSDLDVSVRALDQAGFVDCAAERFQQTWVAASADDLFDTVSRGSVRAAATLRGQTQDALVRIKAAAYAELEKFRSGDTVRVPMGAIIASALKPGEMVRSKATTP